MIFLQIVLTIFGLYFLKNAINKYKKILDFYIALEDYGFLKNVKMFSSLLISLEVLLGLSLVLNLSLIFVIVTSIVLHGIYIWILSKALGKSYEKNCGCFGSNVPVKPEINHFAYNIMMCLLFMIFYAIELRI